MRLILTVRGTNVLDIEVCWPCKGAAGAADAPALQANGGGTAERAESYGDPATISGFGFQAKRGR